jgi:hypothetical protein
MAFSTETGGFGFAVPAPNLAQYSALSELKPLSVTGGGQSPIQFRQQAAWNVPDSHPEYVTEGIASGVGAIAQGITAAFKSKADEKKDALKYQRDLQLAKVKADQSEQEKRDALAERKWYHEELLNNAKDRIDKVTPSEAKSLSTRSLGGMSIPEPKSSGDGDISYPSLKTGRDLTKPDQELDNEVEQMGGAGGNGTDAEKLNLGRSPLADLTSPQGMEAAPDLRGAAVLSALSLIPWGKVDGKYKAAGGLPAESYSPQAPDWLRSPKSVTAPLAKIGGFGDQALPNTDKALADFQSYLGEKQGGNKVMEDAIGVDAIYSEQDAMALRDYARKTGKMEPTIKATQAGYEVNWPTPSVLEAAASRKARADELADFGKGRLDLRQRKEEISTFNQSVDKFNTDPSLKRSKEKLKPVIESFMGDLTELNRMGEGYGSRSILDQSLIDQYVRFATGNVPTHNQYEMLTANRPLFDKLKTLAFKNVPVSSSSLLKPEERKQMANSMVKVLNMEHEGLNTKVENEQRIVNKLKSQKIDESNKPHKFPILKTDEDVQKEISSAEKEMEKAWGGANNKAPKDIEAYKQAVQKHKKALSDFEVAKYGVPSNLDDLSKYGEEIDGIYYPAGWSGRLIYEDDSAYRPLQNAPLPDAAGN